MKRLRITASKAAWAGALATGGLAVAGTATGHVALTTAAGALSVIAILLATGTLSRRDAFDPAVIVAVFLLVLTVGRAAYVLDRHAFGMVVEDQIPLGGHERTFAGAVLAQFAAAALFVVGAARARPRPPAREGQPAVPVDTLPLVLAIAVAAVVSAASIVLLAHEVGGVRTYVDGLGGTRQILFADRGWLLAFPTILPGLVLAWLAARLGSLRTGNGRAVAVMLVALAVVATASTGTRSALVFLFAVPALALFHLRSRRIPVWVAATVAIVIFAGSATWRLHLRDKGAPESGRSGLSGVVVGTFRSPDAQLPDPIATLMLRHPAPKLGSTIASAVLTPIPRRVWSGKPTGANDQFTRLVQPERLELAKVEFAITAAGELYWNFWWPGLALFAALGLAAGAAYRWARTHAHDPLAALLYVSVLGSLLLLLRGDFYNTAIGAGQVFVPALVLLWVGRRIAAVA